MTSVLLCVGAAATTRLEASDLTGAGLNLLHVTCDCSNLVQSVVRHLPDVVICVQDTPDEAFFGVIQALNDGAPRPVLVFTASEDAGQIVRATASGVHALVINGYAAGRLAALMLVAQARFAHDQALRLALADVTGRLEERKSVDRAKAILMRARALSDEDAFRVLRTASMHSNQRLGQVSQHIIHSAHFAEAVNRAGQLRMLSQRLVKLHLNIHLLQRARRQVGPYVQQLDSALRRTDANLAWLHSNFADAAFGDLVDSAATLWIALKSSLQAPFQADTVPQLDVLAEHLLQGAEQLTSGLEIAGAIAPLQVLNRAGRQRMLSQRFAKYALLEVLAETPLAEANRQPMDDTRRAFEAAQHYLNNLPLSTPDIRRALDAAKLGWQEVLAGVADARRVAGQERLARASEELLDVFEGLTEQYERSMQMLVG